MKPRTHTDILIPIIPCLHSGKAVPIVPSPPVEATCFQCNGPSIGKIVCKFHNVNNTCLCQVMEIKHHCAAAPLIIFHLK